MSYEFAVSTFSNDMIIRDGFHVVRSYDTIRCGLVFVVQAPAGTKWLRQVSEPLEGGAYSRSSIALYELPNGRQFRAGGGGPSDLDTLTYIPV